MGMSRHDGIPVEVGEDTPVFRVRQVLNDFFQLFADPLDGMVVTGAEEYLDRVGQVEQLVLCAVLLYLLVQSKQVIGVRHIDGILDDHFLAVDVPFATESQHVENQLFVKVDIENDGVVICLIGEKGGNRSQHTGSQ